MMGCLPHVMLSVLFCCTYMTEVQTLDPTVHKITTKDCGLTKVCLRYPPLCHSSITCHVFITTSYNSKSDVVVFEMGARADYVAIGQNEMKNKPVMVNLRGQYCSRASAGKSFGTFTGNENTSPLSPGRG